MSHAEHIETDGSFEYVNNILSTTLHGRYIVTLSVRVQMVKMHYG